MPWTLGVSVLPLVKFCADLLAETAAAAALRSEFPPFEEAARVEPLDLNWFRFWPDDTFVEVPSL